MTQTRTQGVRGALRDTAARRVTELQSRLLSNDAGVVATLARLRRCDPSDVGAEPLVWGVTLGDLPDELTGFHGNRSALPTPAERALHASLVLYAMHQQSQDEGVHRRGVSLGYAVGQLARARASEEEMDTATLARFHQTALAADFAGHVQHLRGLIQLMRAQKPTLGLDYGLLAVDLWQLADPFQDSRDVLARWGRDLHARSKTPNPANTEETK